MLRVVSLPARVAMLALMLGTAVPAAAAQSGVLLGLGFRRDYRTLWIATDGDSVAVLAQGPGLLVPRSDGFWRVDVLLLDTALRMGAREVGLDQTWIVVAGPGVPWAVAADRVRTANPVVEDDRCDFTRDEETILFLGPDYLSMRAWGGQEGCSIGGPGRWDRYQVWALDSTVPAIGEALDAATSRQLDSALAAIRDSVQAPEIARDSTMVDVLRDCHAGSWGVLRRPGGWEVWGNLAPYRFYCDETQVPLPIPPPRVVVGAGRAPVDLEAVRRAIPGARDAVASPRGDLVVALTRDSLYAARVVDGRIQPPRALMAVLGGIVMEEWALGRFVRRWTEQVRPLLVSREGS